MASGRRSTLHGPLDRTDVELTRNFKRAGLELSDSQFNTDNIVQVLREVHYPSLIPLVVELGFEKEMGEIEAEINPDKRRKCIARKLLEKGYSSWEVLAKALRNEKVGENVLASQLEGMCLPRGTGASILSSLSVEQSIATQCLFTKDKGVRDSISSLVALLSGKQENELDIRSFTTHCMPDYTEAENQSGKGRTGINLGYDRLAVRLDNIYECGSLIEYLIPPSASQSMLHPKPWSAIQYIQRMAVVNITLNDNCIYDVQDSKNLLELCHDGVDEEVKSLLESKHKGAAVNATFEDVHEGKSALMLVCEHGKISLLLIVLDGGADVNFQQQATGQSALHVAAKFGHPRVMRFILESYGADPDLVDQYGWTTLMLATKNENLDMIELLLAKKADTNIAAKDDHCTALMLASKHGNLKIVKSLLDHGADPNAKNNGGASSLSIAAYEGHTEVAMFLVHRGAVVNVIEKDGNSPLTHACTKNNMELINVFCDKGAEMNHRGWTPLMFATKKDNPEMVELIKANKLDINPAAPEESELKTHKVPSENKDLKQSSQQTNQYNIAGIANMIEMFLKAMDQRMNFENVKRSRKGVADIQGTLHPEEII